MENFWVSKTVIFCSAALVFLCGAFSVQAADGTITIIQNTVGEDEYFGYGIYGPTNLSTTEQIPKITTAGGTGSTGPVTVIEGTYRIQQFLLDSPYYEWTNTSGSCTVGGQVTGTWSSGYYEANAVSVLANTNTTCTFNSMRTNVVPTITAISPDTKISGEADFTITVNGTGFIDRLYGLAGTPQGSLVYFGTSALQTTFVSQTQLTAVVAAANIANAGDYPITVVNALNSANPSNIKIFTVTAGQNPVPQITSISPNTVVADSGTFTMAINGSNFMATSTVQLNGVTRSFIDTITPTRITITIPQSDISVAGTKTITITNPTPGGGTSNPQTLTITTPEPGTGMLAITKITTGGNGTFSFTGTAGITPITTIAGTGSQTKSLAAGTYTISETAQANWSLTGSSCSNGTPGAITITSGQTTTCTFNNIYTAPQNPVPQISSISPTSKTEGDGAFTLTINGANFMQTSSVCFGGFCASPVTYVSASQLTVANVAVPGAGTYAITVVNPTPGGGTSNPQTFTVIVAPSPAPQISSISPTSVVAGSGSITLTVIGSGFNASSRLVYGNNIVIASPTTVSATQAIFSVPNNLFLGEAIYQFAIFNPAPGGGTSNAQAFTVTPAPNPVPNISSLSPSSAPVLLGLLPINFAVNGDNFMQGSTIHFGTLALPTTYISASRLEAVIPSEELATPGTKDVTVVNPAPGAEISNAKVFTITPYQPTHGNLNVTKNTTGGNGTFSFTSPAGNFQITTAGNTGSYTIQNVPQGIYSITEAIQTGWEQTQNTCANITVTAGQTASCKFTNTKIQAGDDGSGGGDGGGGGTGNWLYLGIIPIIIVMVVVLALMPK